MSGARIGREILKWLQSLDLSYSVKNLKRDFSNGFLVAEIFSRYYQQDVEMHSYDNGQALQRKLDNWAQLFKFFSKKNIKLDRENINNVVHCKSNEAAVQLIEEMYELLTERRVLKQKAVDPSTEGADVTGSMPSYARPNATSLLSANIRDSELTTTLEDQSIAQARAKMLIDDHNHTLRQEREAQEMQPMQNTYSSTSVQRVLRGPPKPVSQEVEPTQVRFQEVKVRAVDRSIAQLRASRDPTVHGAMSVISRSHTEVGGAHPGGDTAVGGLLHAGPSVLELLSELAAADSELGLAQYGPASFEFFVKEINQLPAAAVTRVLGVASNDVDALGASCLASPKQAWHFFHLTITALTAAEHPAVFSAAIALLCQVGGNIVGIDAIVAEALMRDFGLPRLLPLIKAMPTRQRELLQVVYAFSINTANAHINVIKTLQEGLGDMAPFILALTALVTLETSFSADLLDLYVYYCVIALGMPSSRLRAAALSMLPVVCSQNRELVVQMLPRVSVLSADTWWEVQAQLSKLYSALLASGGPSSDDAQSVLPMFIAVLGRRSPAVLTVALAEAAPLLHAYPGLRPPFVSALSSMPSSPRMLLLAADEQSVPVPAVSATSYDLRPLPMTWPALLVAQELISNLKAQQAPHLERGHAEVLAAAVGGAQPSEHAAWIDWLNESKDYLYVALCDEELCEVIASALQSIFFFLQDGALPTFSTLFSSLRMVFTDSADICQSVALAFLQQLFNSGGAFTSAVFDLLSNFDPEFRSGRLGELIAYVESHYQP